MNHDILYEFRASDEERESAKKIIIMMSNGLKYSESDQLCYRCQKVNKSRECPKCHKGYCNGCMRPCMVCKNEYCMFCMSTVYEGSEERFVCPNCE